MGPGLGDPDQRKDQLVHASGCCISYHLGNWVMSLRKAHVWGPVPMWERALSYLASLSLLYPPVGSPISSNEFL